MRQTLEKGVASAVGNVTVNCGGDHCCSRTLRRRVSAKQRREPWRTNNAKLNPSLLLLGPRRRQIQ